MFGFLAPILAGATAKSVAISAGASLISGAISRKHAQDERYNHFANLAASAQRGGFNPLSVLNATGGGGYGAYAGILSRSPVADAISAGAGTYQQNAADSRMMKHEVDLQQMRQKHEIKLSRMTQAAFGSGGPGGAEGGTSIKVFDVDTKPNEAFSDVELAEQRYGDIVSIPIGISVAAGDIYSTAKDAIVNSAFGQGMLSRANNKASTWDTKNGVPQMPGFTWKNSLPAGWSIPIQPLRMEINRTHLPNPKRPN